MITMCDRDLVTLFPQVVDRARAWSIRAGESADDLVVEEQRDPLPQLMARALDVETMRVVETGGDSPHGADALIVLCFTLHSSTRGPSR